MHNPSPHTFHIPVMGIAYTIDTPVKVARFGISSVISIVEDNLIEEMRKFHCNEENEEYIPIKQYDFDARARRITSYLNLVNNIVLKQFEKLTSEPFTKGSDIVKYFDLLPTSSPLKVLYERMMETSDIKEKISLQNILRKKITAGSIDVNVMTKCDKTNYSKEGDALPAEFSDAMAALRGFAMSNLNSSVIFSAGMNPRLYSYCEKFEDFFPDENGTLKKKIILKVSDYRSAIIQGKLLAKKGLWVSEFRIESGLNCGGHAFATDGYLLAPILEEFKLNKNNLVNELFEICNKALEQKNKNTFHEKPKIKISVQGGIGTANENKFLMEYYNIDSTGWGSPFLLVPEVTNVDDETLQQLVEAKKEDFYLSDASPLGIPFHNFRKSSAIAEKNERIEKGKPGSPCYNKYLAFNTEFTERPICTASRQYQELKIKDLISKNISGNISSEELTKITEKECICQGLGTSVFLKNKIPPPHKIKSVSICPGPNLAYFSSVFSLRDMVDHIYGRKNILNNSHRPNMFINELILYVNYLNKEIKKYSESINEKQSNYLKIFKNNLLTGIAYYKQLANSMTRELEDRKQSFIEDLKKIETSLVNIQIPGQEVLV